MRRTKQEWFFIINDQKSSGMSISRYCKANGICAGTFYAHKRDLSPSSKQHDEGQFLPVTISDGGNPTISFKVDGHSFECQREDAALILEVLL